MAGSQHLYRRDSGVYFVRLCVPARLKSAVGKGEIHRTTGTREYRVAKIVAAELVAHWHRAIQVLERMDIKKIKAGSIDLLGDGHIALTQAAQILGTTEAALAARLRLRRAPFFVVADQWLGWVVQDIDEAVEYFPDRVTGKDEYVIDNIKLDRVAGPPTRFSGLLSLRFADEAVQIAEAAESVAACQFVFWPSTHRGFVVDLPGQPLHNTMLLVRRMDIEALRFELASQITPEMLAAVPTLPVADPGSNTEGAPQTWSEFMTHYLACHKGVWKNDQQRRREDHMQMFLELMGDVKLAEISRTTMRRYSEKLAQLPHDRHLIKVKYKCLEAGFAELTELANTHDLPRMTLQARQRVLDSMSEVFTWAVSEELIKSNPAKGLGGELLKKSGIKRKTKAHDQRDALSADDLQRVFSGVWFRTGSGQKTPKGLFYAYRPHYYWLPLLAIYQGGRLNELSQLYLKDIKVSEDGIAYLDFNLVGDGKMDIDEDDGGYAADKSLKTVSAERIVPVHQRILDLDFLEYVRSLREAGYTRLFPELRHDKNKGYGKAAGSWFNERYLGRELGIPRNGRKTFHSLRHNFATALGLTSVPANVMADLMGHVRALTMAEARYDKGGDLAMRQGAINSLTFPLPDIAVFNVTDGIQAVADALRLKMSHAARAA